MMQFLKKNSWTREAAPRICEILHKASRALGFISPILTAPVPIIKDTYAHLKSSSKSVVSISAMALASLLISCSSPDPTTATSSASNVKAFSHTSYTFAPGIAGDAFIYSEELVGRVLPNTARIRYLVAANLADDAIDPSTLRESTDYTISFDIDAALDSPADTFFTVRDQRVNGLKTGRIYVTDRPASGLTFDEIRGFLSSNSINVKISITINTANSPVKQGSKTLIEDSVRVNILNRDDRVDLTSTANHHLLYDRPSGELNFSLSGGIEENKPLTSLANFGSPQTPSRSSSRPLNALAVRTNPNSNSDSRVTLFYDLRDITDVSVACAQGSFYIDNSDNTIRSGKTYNYEEDLNNLGKSYSCRLAASTDGVTYHPLAFVINNNSATANRNDIKSDITNDIKSGTKIEADQIASAAQVRQSGFGNQFSCSPTNSCYYSDFNLAVRNVNEAPQVSLVGGDSFVGSREGVGPIKDYASLVAVDAYYAGGPLAGQRIENTVTINITDEDLTQEGTEADFVTVASVFPSHGRNAFKVEQVQADRQKYQLVVNGSLLDYEAFSAGQLTEDGKAIYKVRIRARDSKDNSVADIETFNFEVSDVKYPPVFVNPANRNEARTPTAAFVQDDSIINGTNGSPLYLPAGLLAIQFSRLGELAAVNPETGSPANLEYRISPAVPVVLSNHLSIVSGANDLMYRLVVSGLGLAARTNGDIIIQVSPDNFSARSINSITVPLSISNTIYNDVVNKLATSRRANFTFKGALPIQQIEERVTETPEVLVSFTEGDRFINTIAGGTTAEPNFGFAPADSISASFASDISQVGFEPVSRGIRKFIIENGVLSLRAGEALEFPARYILPIFVNSGGSFNPDQDAVTVLIILVTDTNEAPIARQNGRVLNATERKLTGTIDENRPAGTVIAQFTVTDDNQDRGSPSVSFPAADEANLQRLLNLESQNNPDGSVTVTLSSAVEFDFEKVADRNLLENININLEDSGSYVYTSPDSLTSDIRKTPILKNIETTLAASITIRDLPETPELEISQNVEFSISENAAAGTRVTSTSDGLIGNVVARLVNPSDYPNSGPNSAGSHNRTRIKYQIEGSFRDILKVVENPILDSTSTGVTRVALYLEVIDADASDKLEDLGDGRNIQAILVATDSVSRRSSRTTLLVKINDDPANSRINRIIVANATNGKTLSINEQDVAGRTNYIFPSTAFKIPINEQLSKDANEAFRFSDSTGRRRRLSPNFDVRVEVSKQGQLNPSSFINSANIARLVERRVGGEDLYLLEITDTDFIESALFGDLSLILAGQFFGGTTKAPVRFSVGVIPAANKGVVYANTDRTPIIPVYAFSYTQNNYATQVQASASTRAIRAADIDFVPNQMRGVSQQHISIGDPAEFYETISLTGQSGRFIKRSPTSNNMLQSLNSNAAVGNGNGDNGEIVINFNRDSQELLSFDRFDLLRENANGDLIPVNKRELTNYFNIEINNTQSARRLIITPKTFPSVANSNSAEDQPQASYAALDTILLFEEGKTTHTLNYFIGARSVPAELADPDDASRNITTTGASNYALAQFSVQVNSVTTKDSHNIRFTAAANNIIGLNINTGTGRRFPIEYKLTNDAFMNPPMNPTAANWGATNYDQVTFQFTQPSGTEISCIVNIADGTPLITNPSPTYQRDGRRSVILTGNLAKDASSSLTLNDILQAPGCGRLEFGSRITAVEFQGVESSLASGATLFDEDISVALTSHRYTIQGYRQTSPSISSGVFRNMLDITAGETKEVTITITDRDPEDGTPLNPIPTNANVVRPSIANIWPSQIYAIVQSRGSELGCRGEVTAVAGPYTPVSGRPDQVAITLTITASPQARASFCRIVPSRFPDRLDTIGEDNRPTSTQITLNIINDAPAASIAAISVVKLSANDVSNNDPAHSTALELFDLGTRVSNNQGLTELAVNAPYRTNSSGLFFIELHALSDNQDSNTNAEDNIGVTFSSSSAGGDCVISQVKDLSDKGNYQADLSLNNGIATNLYKITHKGGATGSGGTCQALTLNAIAVGISGSPFHSVTIPANTLVFTAPAVTPPTSFIPPSVFADTQTGLFTAEVGQDIIINLTAIKQDPSPNTLVSFPRVVTSASGEGFTTCEAVLSIAPTALLSTSPLDNDIFETNYNSNTIGSFTSVLYRITSPTSPDIATNCGLFTFNATENGATGENTIGGIAFTAAPPPLKIFVNALYASDLNNLTNIGDSNLRLLSHLAEGTRTLQGLNILTRNAPHTTNESGLFFLEVNATASDLGLVGGNINDIEVTFSDGFAAGDCSIVPVNITGGERDLSFDGGVAGTLYKITYTGSVISG
ncbi:MAG: hypothetical protein HAW61_00885, partial [Candidatus Portiera sp.]|nr:hypothetical protein [Portiera sp.]